MLSSFLAIAGFYLKIKPSLSLHLRNTVFCVFVEQKISEKPQVIADYECGKAIPNNQVMGKIERAIGKQLIHRVY